MKEKIGELNKKNKDKESVDKMLAKNKDNLEWIKGFKEALKKIIDV